MILNAMFKAGDNSRPSLRWELLDTPPALAWREMLEYTLDNPKPRAINLLELGFCRSKPEACKHWEKLRGFLRTHNCEIDPDFDDLTHADMMRIKAFLFQLLAMNQVEVDEFFPDMKNVMFWLNHRGIADGQIYWTPDPHVCVDFDPSWIPYFTMQTEPGTLYAEVTFEVLPWPLVTSIEDKFEAITLASDPEMGQPRQLGSGFMVPFGPDMSDLILPLELFWSTAGESIRALNPNFSADAARKVSGRIPLGKLIEKPDYKDFKAITHMFKLELMESWT